MTIPVGTHYGIWVDTEPRFFINIGLHLDIQSGNAIVYLLWWRVMLGCYVAREVEQPHWDAVVSSEVEN